jgi:3-hydroxy-3-methylglutaryl CoA synthase
MSVGIVGYGAFIPRRRIKLEEIAKVGGADAPSCKRGLQLNEKSVLGADEDTVTMPVRLEFRRISWDGNAGLIFYGHKAVKA